MADRNPGGAAGQATSGPLRAAVGSALRFFVFAPTTFIRIATRLAALVIFTRLLSAEDYGVYTLVLSAVALGQTLVFLWIEAAAFRFYERARRGGWLPDLLATLSAGAAASAGLAGLAAITAAGVFFATGRLDLVAAAGAGLALAVGGFLANARREVLRAEGRVGRYAVLDAAAKIGGLVFGAGLVAGAGWGALGPLGGSILALVMVLFADAVTWRAIPRPGRFRAGLARSGASFGFGLAIGQGAAVLLSSGDRFVVAAVLGAEATGVYAAGYGLAAQLVGFLFAGASLAAAPLTLRAFETNGAEEGERVARRYAEVVTWIAAPAAVGLAMIAEPLAHLVIGSDLAAGSVMVIQWIAPASVLAGLLTGYADLPFTLTRKTRDFALIVGAAAVLNIALNISLVPHFGLSGAMAATVLAYAAGLSVAVVVGRRLLFLPLPWGHVARVTGATVVMVLAILAIRATMLGEVPPTSVINLLVVIPLGVLAYVGTYSALRQFSAR